MQNERKGCMETIRHGLLRGSGQLLQLALSNVTGLFHFLEIVEVVNFDSVNLFSLAGEDL
jgi:hypothetical protein